MLAEAEVQLDKWKADVDEIKALAADAEKAAKAAATSAVDARRSQEMRDIGCQGRDATFEVLVGRQESLRAEVDKIRQSPFLNPFAKRVEGGSQILKSAVVDALAGEADDDVGETVADDVNQHEATARAKPRAAA